MPGSGSAESSDWFQKAGISNGTRSEKVPQQDDGGSLEHGVAAIEKY